MIEHVVAHLKASALVSALNGNRVYPDAAPENLATSVVVTEIASVPNRVSTGAVSSWVSTYQVVARADTRKLAGQIGNAIISALDNLSGTINGATFDRALLEDSRDENESSAKRRNRTLIFNIYH